MSALDDLITKIDANTTAVAKAMMALHADLVTSDGAASKEQLDRLAQIAAHLESLCAVQADPVPPVPPALTAPVAAQPASTPVKE